MIYDFVFIVLVYRNTTDLENFFRCFNLNKSKVIVVNSYYDDKTKDDFKQIASNNGADFINIENNGYGYGNNRGCEYAIANYIFKFLVISNADIEIRHIDINCLNYEAITGPKIITKTGKNQNPYRAFSSNTYEKIVYYGWKKRNKIILTICFALNRLIRELYLLKRRSGKVYAVHGSFVIFPCKILHKMFPVYDENIFLFAEEDDIAHKAHNLNLDFVYNPKIQIFHKEDGSTSSLNNSFEYVRKSALYLNKKWFKSI